MQGESTALLDQHRDLAQRIVEIAEIASDSWTVGHTGRRLAGAHPIAAEIAFHHHVLLVALRTRLLIGRHAVGKIVLWLVVEVPVGVGAGHHAGAAADAQIVVYVDDAVLPLEARTGRAGVDARRIFAMVAQHGQEELANGRILTLLVLEHARIVDAGRRAVLRLACQLAAVTSDTALEIDHHSPSHDRPSAASPAP